MKPALALVLIMTVAACGEPSTHTPGTTWSMRLDDADASLADGAGTSDRVTTLPDGGIEVKSGPNMTLWYPSGEATGAYRLSMDVTTSNEALHGHGAGLVFGGSDVHGEEQAYTYFLVRGDGQFLIKTRDADETEDVCEWTEHAAINREDAEFRASNRLEVEVGTEATRFLINGGEVHSADNATLRTAGRYGARLVHDLKVRFTNVQLQALGQ